MATDLLRTILGQMVSHAQRIMSTAQKLGLDKDAQVSEACNVFLSEISKVIHHNHNDNVGFFNPKESSDKESSSVSFKK